MGNNVPGQRGITRKMEVVPVLGNEGAVRQPAKIRQHKRSVAEREEDLVKIARWYIEGFTQQEIADKINAIRYEKYTIKRGTIADDIAEILYRWQRTYMGAMEELKGRQLASLDHLEATLWSMFERSCQDRIESEHLLYQGENVGIGGKNGEESPTGQEDEKGQNRADGDGGVGEAIASGLYVDKRSIPTKTGGKPGSTGSQSQSKSFYREKRTEKRISSYGDVNIIEEIRRVVETRSKILGIIVQKTVTANWRKEAESQGYNPDELVDSLTKGIIDGEIRDAPPR